MALGSQGTSHGVSTWKHSLLQGGRAALKQLPKQNLGLRNRGPTARRGRPVRMRSVGHGTWDVRGSRLDLYGSLTHPATGYHLSLTEKNSRFKPGTHYPFFSRQPVLICQWGHALHICNDPAILSALASSFPSKKIHPPPPYPHDPSSKMFLRISMCVFLCSMNSPLLPGR